LIGCGCKSQNFLPSNSRVKDSNFHERHEKINPFISDGFKLLTQFRCGNSFYSTHKLLQPMGRGSSASRPLNYTGGVELNMTLTDVISSLEDGPSGALPDSIALGRLTLTRTMISSHYIPIFFGTWSLLCG